MGKNKSTVKRSVTHRKRNWIIGYTAIILYAWSLFIVWASHWEIKNNQNRTVQFAKFQALSTFQTLNFYCRQPAEQPALQTDNNTLETIPQIKKDSGQQIHFICADPECPKCLPDAWEVEALKSAKNQSQEITSVETIDGQSYLRSLKMCPADTNFRCVPMAEGHGPETEAAISIAVPLEPLLTISRYEIGNLSMGYITVWCGGALVILIGHFFLRRYRNKHLRFEDELIGQVKQARQETMRKSEFLANMSHEFRTPMNAIIGFTELLIEEELTEQQKEYLKTVQNSGKGLLELINDILDISKIESGKLKIIKKQCPVQTIIDDIKLLMGTDIESKGLKFHVLKAMGVPESIYTDGLRLRQCLLNLISNAIKFTDAGSVTLHISMYFDKKRQWYRFDIQDTGIGIPVKKQKDIFREYVQAEDTTTHTYGGTGLGLYITQQLIELLDGKITVQSQVGEGATFSIHLPHETPAAEAQTQPETEDASLKR